MKTGVRGHSRESTFTHVVSVGDVGTRSDGPSEVAAFFPAGRFHQLRFNDVELDAAGAVTHDMVRGVLQFGAGLGPDDRVLIHYLADVSRSAGVAFALACQYAPPGVEDAVSDTSLFRLDLLSRHHELAHDPGDLPEPTDSPIYLLAWCLSRNAPRTFRLDRILPTDI